ncbi:MAG: ABC transporter ATP-binding protein [Microbacteriaceae bacterium]
MSKSSENAGMSNAFVAIDNVSFTYPGTSVPILSDVSLELKRGEFFVLLGPSGCGKTTILNQLAGFESPTTGRITVDGKEVLTPGSDRVVIFQGDDSLLGWLNVAHNVEFGLRMAKVPRAERERKVAEALEMVELSAQSHKFPHELSGGMKQRVQIARALVADAPVLLMDEPFGALDAQTRTSLQDALASIWVRSQPTVLFITHDISEALILGDRIGVMTSGPRAGLYTVVENDLPRPRARGDVSFTARYGALEEAVTKAKARATEVA